MYSVPKFITVIVHTRIIKSRRATVGTSNYLENLKILQAHPILQAYPVLQVHPVLQAQLSYRLILTLAGSVCHSFLEDHARTYLQPHYGNVVFGNVYLSAGQH